MCCDHPAKRHSDKVRLLPAQRVEQRTHVSDVSVKAVVVRPAAVSVSPHVEGDCMNFVTQAQADIVPRTRGQLAAMQKKYLGTVAAPIQPM